MLKVVTWNRIKNGATYGDWRSEREPRRRQFYRDIFAIQKWLVATVLVSLDFSISSSWNMLCHTTTRTCKRVLTHFTKYAVPCTLLDLKSRAFLAADCWRTKPRRRPCYSTSYPIISPNFNAMLLSVNGPTEKTSKLTCKLHALEWIGKHVWLFKAMHRFDQGLFSLRCLHSSCCLSRSACVFSFRPPHCCISHKTDKPLRILNRKNPNCSDSQLHAKYILGSFIGQWNTLNSHVTRDSR